MQLQLNIRNFPFGVNVRDRCLLLHRCWIFIFHLLYPGSCWELDAGTIERLSHLEINWAIVKKCCWILKPCCGVGFVIYKTTIQGKRSTQNEISVWHWITTWWITMFWPSKLNQILDYLQELLLYCSLSTTAAWTPELYISVATHVETLIQYPWYSKKQTSENYMVHQLPRTAAVYKS